MDTAWIGRALIVLGVVLLAAGAWLAWGPRLPWLGRLPGDFSFGGENWKVYVPLGTSLLISVALSAVLWLFQRR